MGVRVIRLQSSDVLDALNTAYVEPMPDDTIVVSIRNTPNETDLIDVTIASPDFDSDENGSVLKRERK